MYCWNSRCNDREDTPKRVEVGDAGDGAVVQHGGDDLADEREGVVTELRHQRVDERLDVPPATRIEDVSPEEAERRIAEWAAQQI